MKKQFIILSLLLCSIFAYAEKNLAVATFDVVGGAVTQDEAEGITELFIAELVNTKKVNVVDRTNFQKILNEMKFQSSDWSNSEKTMALGKAVNADVIARGQIIKLGHKLYLSATIIDDAANVLSSAKREFTSIENVFDALKTFARDLMGTLFINIRIGGIGPGGGIIFSIEDGRCLECSPNLGTSTWYDAESKCRAYRGGNYDDWYLPSKRELDMIYRNLKCNGYISDEATFWSSSSGSSSAAWILSFLNGNWYCDMCFGYKGSHYSVRAVRTFTY